MKKITVSSKAGKIIGRALMLVGAVTTVFSLAGCEKDVPNNREEVALTSEPEIAGWTIDEITDGLQLDGVKFCMPCSFDELQGEFNENKNISFSEADIVKIDNEVECNRRSIFFDNNEIGIILSSLNSDEVFGIHINVYLKDYTSFNFDNICIGKTTSDEIFDKYGVPTRGGNGLFFYQCGKRKDISFVFDNDVLQAIVINNVSNYDELIDGEYDSE